MSVPIIPINGGPAQYAGKKRRCPQAKKDKQAGNEASTSNPSKRHRERLNTELKNLTNLVPFPEEVINKLDKLSILRLTVSYLRNKNYHSIEHGNSSEHRREYGQLVPTNQRREVAPFKESESRLALMALHGFLIVVAQDFNIFYVTETVQDYLGFPQCDIMNLSMLDLVHVDDRETFLKHMQIHPQTEPGAPPGEDDRPVMPEYVKYGMSQEMFRDLSQNALLHRSFICRLRCLLDNSSGFLALHFTGHLRIVPGQNKRSNSKALLPPETALFLLASPLQSPSILEIRTKNLIFRTKHKLDYTPLGIDARGRSVLGYTEQQLRQRSGYEFIHSADMMHCADAHTKLMRQGESGLTVFRLLHKDNNWVWVTASARLTFKNNHPDYIIATQRPILDQEAEEHMKKRNNAFRFDFTGQAVLYGQVNPIGTRGGPENNPLEEGGMENNGPSNKRIRISNDAYTLEQQSVDRKTLYGAQSMQRMDIYAGSLPNQSSDNYEYCGIAASAGVVQELMENDIGPLTNDSDIHFYPMGNEVPINQQQVPNLGQDFQTNDGANFQDNFSINSLPVQPSFECVPSSQVTSQPCVSNFSVDNYQNANVMTKQEPPRLYHPPNKIEHLQQHLPEKYNYQPNSLKRPCPESWNQPQPVDNHRVSIGKSMHSQVPINNADHTLFAEQFQNQKHYRGPTQNLQPHVLSHEGSHRLHFTKQGDKQSLDAMASAKMIKRQQRMDIHGYMQPVQHFSHNFNQQPPSVIESMTIQSMITENKQINQQQMQMQGGKNIANTQYQLSNHSPSFHNNWNKIEMVGCQANRIQFDLDKIASDYQTTDPMSKVEDYLKEHPEHAMAIATGHIPEDGMPKLAANKVNAYMTSYQYSEPHPTNTSLDPQYVSPGSSNTGKNMMTPAFLTPQSEYLEDVGYMSASVSSCKSLSTASLTNSHTEVSSQSAGNLYQDLGYQ